MKINSFSKDKKLKVFISGQKYFGSLILNEMIKNPCVDVVGVCTPYGDKYVGVAAAMHNIPILSAGLLNAETMPHGVDVGITAHSFDYIGRLTRYRPSIGWVGYHPSLLPRHRGRSSIEWAIRMRDYVTGGTTFWLNGGIDRGDIIEQELVWIDPKMYAMDAKQAAKILWERELQDVGVRLINKTINDIICGIKKGVPQDNRFSTFEPSTDVKDIYRPDALLLNKGLDI
jgi:methionyl-tRNA formyltransferase